MAQRAVITITGTVLPRSRQRQQVEAAAVRQHEIEQRAIDRGAIDHRRHVGGAAQPLAGEALHLERPLQRAAEVQVVFDQQDVHGPILAGPSLTPAKERPRDGHGVARLPHRLAFSLAGVKETLRRIGTMHPALRRRDLLLWPLAAGLSPHLPAQEAADPHAWLEAMGSPAVRDWLVARNAEALALVGREPDFARRQRDTLAALSAATNLPFVTRHGEHLYNFYRSARRPHGVWRRTTLEQYARPRPAWEVLLDVDALAREEMRNVVFSGANVHAASQRALVFLSAGGEDKVEMREFDLAGRGFVPGGFSSPSAKQWVAWFGPDELLISTETGPGSTTASGYGRLLRRWKRGTDLLAAPVVMECAPGDMRMEASTRRGEGLPPVALLRRRQQFWRSERFLLRADGTPQALGLPQDAEAWLDLEWLVVWLRGPWTAGGQRHAGGSVLAIPLDQATAEARTVHVLLEGRERRQLVRAEPVKDGFVVSHADNLRPRLVFQRWDGTAFRPQALPVPEFGIVQLRMDRPDRDNRVWATAEGPLSPERFALVDAAASAAPVVDKVQPPWFDARGLEVAQFEARSADGTRIPYTVIGAPAGAPRATVLWGYGGFGISVDQVYQRLPGLNWLQYGGTMVLAHIRGGGEFGPAWYEAGKGRSRQVAFDDFIAVAEDLVARGITTPAQLGLYGASNGGALVTAVMVQRPELFGAVVSRVPLTDMLGFTRLFAGASWIEEYGDPQRPADREVLARWSPYHNVAPAAAGKRYPPILFIGNSNDDRVHPAHARKMVERLRQAGHAQAWLYEEASGGHSGRTDPRIHALREALVYSFLRLHLGNGTAARAA